MSVAVTISINLIRRNDYKWKYSIFNISRDQENDRSYCITPIHQYVMPCDLLYTNTAVRESSLLLTPDMARNFLIASSTVVKLVTRIVTCFDSLSPTCMAWYVIVLFGLLWHSAPWYLSSEVNVIMGETNGYSILPSIHARSHLDESVVSQSRCVWFFPRRVRRRQRALKYALTHASVPNTVMKHCIVWVYINIDIDYY